MNVEVNRKCHITFLILSAYLTTFSRWFAHLCFGLGRGPITPPGPAMALTDQNDLNLAIDLTKKVSFFVRTAETRSTLKCHVLYTS